jgi:hypothetical protein
LFGSQSASSCCMSKGGSPKSKLPNCNSKLSLERYWRVSYGRIWLHRKSATEVSA